MAHAQPQGTPQDGLPDPGRFRSCTLPVPASWHIDPIDLASKSDPALQARTTGVLLHSTSETLAGRGAATTLPLRDATGRGATPTEIQQWLDAVPLSDEVSRPGSGPVVFGALPFDPAEPCRLVVPALVLRSDPSGTRWVTVVGPAGARLPHSTEQIGDLLDSIGARSGISPAKLCSSSGLSAEEDRELAGSLAAEDPEPGSGRFVANVNAVLHAIDAAKVAKVVLARSVRLRLARGVDPGSVLRNLARLDPRCTVFAAIGESEAFLGATPELLVRRRGSTVKTHPLAGTTGLTGEPAADRRAIDELLKSPKELAEHLAVVEQVAVTLGPLCERISFDGPTISELRLVAHLGTQVTGCLRPPRVTGLLPSLLELTAALHPTPAVAGSPTRDAMDLIARLEGSSRGRYAGPVGWMDRNGDGQMMVGIRSMLLHDGVADLYAGAGIVAGSEPGAELAETTLKLRGAIDAIAAAYR